MTDLDHRPGAPQVEDQAPDLHPPRSDRRISEAALSLIRLLAVLVTGSVVLVMLGAGPAALVIALFFVMIMLHELGHFLTARWAGMKVTEFFVGFGPRLWSFRRGETEYGIKAIPLGGYCKIIGMSNIDPQVDPADEPRTYRQKSYPRRLSVAVAGSVMHMILAFAMLLALNGFVGNPAHRDVEPVIEQLLGFQNGPSPAQQAGLQVGDRILEVDGNPVENWATDAAARIAAKPNQPVELVVQRGSEQVTLTAIPGDLRQINSELPPEDQRPASQLPAADRAGFLGVSAKGVYPTTSNPLVLVGRSLADVGSAAAGAVSGLLNIFSLHGISSYTEQVFGEGDAKEEANRFVSPVGLARLSGTVARNGVRDVLSFLVLINVFVGIFNMLPILPFDGGHVLIATYERIRSRRGKRYFADVSKMLPFVYATVAALLFISLSSIYLDVFEWNF